MAANHNSEDPDDLDLAAGAALGGEILGTLDPLLMVQSLAKAVSPGALVRTSASLASRVPQILLGLENAELPERDYRFRDEAFRENVVYRRYAAAYHML